MSEDPEVPETHAEPELLARPGVPELDGILGKPFKVLDDGFVRLVDYMGSDQSIVQAARVSYGEGTKQVSQDGGLIRYLMRHHHTTPFEMCELKLHVRVPMDCWRQWIRHRTASVNEYSTRYSIAIDAAQITEPDQWRLQSAGNRQGSDGRLDAKTGEAFTQRELGLLRESREIYEQRIEAGIAREQARKDLPLSTYTEAYWKTNLHNLFHFLRLRMDEHAQWEIRQYALTIGHEMVQRWCPLAWQAFLDYSVESMSLTHLEWQIVRAIQSGDRQEAIALAVKFRFLSEDGTPRRNRERSELEGKLRQLNIVIPWAE